MKTEAAFRLGGALYIAVIGMTLIASLLAMTGISASRVERRQAVVVNHRLIARVHARSAVELALRQINENENWRSAYDNGVESTTWSLGSNSVGTVSWMIQDSDGNLTNPDTKLTLKGIGRVGDTVQVSSIEVQPGTVGPNQLRSQTSLFNSTNDKLKNDKEWCQYLKVSLPSNAIGWKISTVEIYARRDKNNRAFTLNIYQPLANLRPSATLIDSASLNSNGVPTTWGYYPIVMTGAYWLPPAQGVCIALESSVDDPIELTYRSSGMSEANSALVRGTPAWQPAETDKALRYRVHGYYATAEGVYPVTGTWDWDQL